MKVCGARCTKCGHFEQDAYPSECAFKGCQNCGENEFQEYWFDEPEPEEEKEA